MTNPDPDKLWPQSVKRWLRWTGRGSVSDYIEQLEADKRRLDWLADRNNHIGNVQLPTECVMPHLDDLRAAIDAAMGLQPDTGGKD